MGRRVSRESLAARGRSPARCGRVGFYPMSPAGDWSILIPPPACFTRSPGPIQVPQTHLEPGHRALLSAMRNDYFKEALEIVGDPYVLVNMVWGRVQMLRRGDCPLIESLEELSPEEIALREIAEGRITRISGNMAVLGRIVVLENVVSRNRAGDPRSNTSTSPFVDAPCNAADPA